MKIDLLYGKYGLELQLPETLDVSVVKKHPRTPIGGESEAGYPLDKTYYQTVKGMVGVLDMVAPGGDIIIASECSEGMGSGEFVTAQRLLSRMGPDAFLAELKTREKALIDEWRTEMLVKALKRGRIHLYTTGLSTDSLKDTCVNPISSVEKAVLKSVQKHNNNRVAVVPEGPYVVPRIDLPQQPDLRRK